MKRSYSEPVPEPAAKQQDTQRKRDVRSEEYSKELSTATAYLNTTSTQLWTFKDLRQELQSAGCKHTTTALNLLTRASHVRMLRVSPAHCLIIRKGVSLSAGLEQLIGVFACFFRCPEASGFLRGVPGNPHGTIDNNISNSMDTAPQTVPQSHSTVVPHFYVSLCVHRHTLP